MPQAILASEDPVSEEEVPVIVNKKVVDEVKSNEAHSKDGNDKVAVQTDDVKEKSKKVESTKSSSSSSSKKSKNSYSIAALCQVNKISNSCREGGRKGGTLCCYFC